MSATMKRYEIEREENWREIIGDMPFISFPSDWIIKIIPPFGGAMVRFLVDLPCGVRKSVYADFHHNLGYYGHPDGQPIPYWEVYPYCGDVGRCLINDTSMLLEMIADTKEQEQ